MENSKENPGPSKSDVIIITPDELLKLGLFQDLQTAVKPANQISEAYVAKLKQQIKNRIKAAAEHGDDSKSKQKDNVEPVTSKSTVLKEPKHKIYGKQKSNAEPVVLNNTLKTPKIQPSLPCATVREKSSKSTEIKCSNVRDKHGKLETNTEKSTSVKKNEISNKTQNTLMKRGNDKPPDKPIILNSTIIKPTDIGTTILNSEIKFKKIKFPTSQSKVDFNREKPEILNSKMKIANIKSVEIDDVIPVSNCPQLENVEECKDSAVNNSKISIKTEDFVAVIKEEKCDELKDADDKEVEKKYCIHPRVEGSPQIIKRSDSTDSAMQPLLSTDPSKKISVIDSPKKEVNVISNQPVRFSNEELHTLVLNAKTKFHCPEKITSIKIHEEKLQGMTSEQKKSFSTNSKSSNKTVLEKNGSQDKKELEQISTEMCPKIVAANKTDMQFEHSAKTEKPEELMQSADKQFKGTEADNVEKNIEVKTPHDLAELRLSKKRGQKRKLKILDQEPAVKEGNLEEPNKKVVENSEIEDKSTQSSVETDKSGLDVHENASNSNEAAFKENSEVTENSEKEDKCARRTLETDKSTLDVQKNASDLIAEDKPDIVKINGSIGDLNITENIQEESNLMSLQQFESTSRNASNNEMEAEVLETKTPKKKGRPRKNASESVAQVKIEPALPPESEGEPVASLPVAKRGRKRKTSSSITETPQSSEAFILDESMSGRKRKKINYFELENSIKIEDNDEKKKRRKRILSPITKISKEKPKDVIMKSPKVENLCNLVVPKIEGNNSNENIGIESRESDSNLIKYEKISQDNIKDEDKESTADTSSTNGSEKKLKYRKTGETALMMSSIFTAAFKNKPKNTQEAEETDSNRSLEKPIRIDRRRRAAKVSAIVIDEDNMVTCVACNTKIDNEEWKDHNRHVHYNLAWRQGEQELSLDDSAFLTRTLRPILQKDKSLKCKKCAKESKIVKDFVAHLEECSGIVSSCGSVTCAVCKADMEKTKWPLHKQSKHNNLAWRIGDHPLNLNDQNLVMSILNALYKAKKPLHCEKCGALKKSVVGFLSHQAQCGADREDIKVQCEFCEKKVLPVSMQSHIKLVHEVPKFNELLLEAKAHTENRLDTSLKRKAARTAMLIIDKFSKDKIVQEYNKHYMAQVDFNEENFVAQILQKELTLSQTTKCKFKKCEFETGEVKVLLDHMNECENKPDQYYTCKKCLLICDNEDAIKDHIKTAYKVDIVEDDFKAEYNEESEEDDVENELYKKEIKKRMIVEKKRLEKDINYKVKPSILFKCTKRPYHLFSHALQFTLEFCSENFSHILFDHLRHLKNDWAPLDDELVEEYLPGSQESCLVARRTVTGSENVLDTEYALEKFELFESNCDEGIATIFCGGPIYAMAWLPTPFTTLESKQALAVAAAKDFDRRYLVKENYSEPCVIQFWDFGALRNKRLMPSPRLMFFLAFDFGPVWHMEWCPSGCYDTDATDRNGERMSRMGLLAVAGSNSPVYIYSIPFLEEEEMGLIYEAKPLLTLQLELKEEDKMRDKFYPTRISWTMGQGHRYVAVGYTNGMVALFDVDTKSVLLKLKNDEDGDVLLPYKTFQAHLHYVSALCWIPLGDGSRWLLTASFDRTTYVWDFGNDSKVYTIKKHIITDGVWLTNWVAYVTTSDESSTNFNAVHARIRSYRDYMYEHVYLTNSPTSILSISSSNWLNSIVQSSSVGEVIALFPNQLLFCLDSEKNLKSFRYLLGYTKLLNRHKTPEERTRDEKILREVQKGRILKSNVIKNPNSELSVSYNALTGTYEPMTYKEARETYGLLFCDLKMDKFSEMPKCPNFENLDYSKANQYSLQAINKIAYNPNRQASLYYACGYQAGFVRVTYMKFLENDPQVG